MQSIAARRKREAAERELVASVKANQDLEAKIRFSNRNHTATSTKTPESGDTEERKGRLRNLLESEEQQCLHRIASYQETPDQRNKRLVDLAIRLKKDREDERLRFVTEMLEEREKTSSDEARTLAAKEAEADTAAILLMQIEDKRASRARDQDEERLLEELWHRDYASKLAREQLEARRRADANVILRQALDQQIKDKLSRATPNEFIEDVYIKGERCDQTRLHRPHPAAHVAILKKPTSPREDTIVAKMVQEEKVRLLAEIQVQERQAARLREYIADHHLDRERRAITEQRIEQIQQAEADRQANFVECTQNAQEKQRQQLMAEVYTERENQVRERMARMQAQKQQVEEEKDRVSRELEEEKVRIQNEMIQKHSKTIEYRETLMNQIRNRALS